MGVLYLRWDNTAALANPNVIAQRASKRIKTVGGAYSTLGFTPTNDLVMIAVPEMSVTVVDNKVYEFKVESICSSGGPTANSNGIQEGIAFVCIPPDISEDIDTVTVNVDLAGTDITKVRYTLRRQDNNVIIGGPTIVNKVADAALHIFDPVDDNTAYYLTVEMYAVVGGVEVISSNINYLGDVCGGNVAGYQITTSPAPLACTAHEVTAGVGNCTVLWTECESGAPLASLLTSGNTETYCARNGEFNITGDHTIDSTVDCTPIPP